VLFVVALVCAPRAGRSQPFSEAIVSAPNHAAGDDTTRIQRAIDKVAMTGGVVRIRAGVYRLDVRDGVRVLTPRARVRILGEGVDRTILRIGSGQGQYKAVFYPHRDDDDLTGFELKDLTVDQNGEANAVRSALDLAGHPRAVVVMFAGSRARVENCRFTGLVGTNSLIFNGTHVSDIRIVNNEFDNVGNPFGFQYDHSTIYTHAERVHIAGNTFRGRRAGGGAFGATTAIEIHGSQQIVSGNIIEGYLQGMNVTGVADASDSILVTGNTIVDAADGIQLWSYFYGSNRGRPALAGVVVSANTIRINRDPWIHVADASKDLVGSGIEVNPKSDAPIDGLRIDGNVITFEPSKAGTPSDDQSAGIEMWLVTDRVVSHGLSVTNNQISGSYGPGIRLSLSAETVELSRNQIRNPATSTGAFADPFRAGILVSHKHKGLSIRGNEIAADRPASRMRYAIYDATMEGSSDLLAVDNQVMTDDPSVPPFENVGGGPFFVSMVTDRSPILPTHAVAAGSTIRDISTGRVRTQITAPAGTAWRSQAYAEHAPEEGAWQAGDIVYNTRPLPGGSVGWICVVGGTPGTFRPFGQTPQ
jgi:hypothetical protein